MAAPSWIQTDPEPVRLPPRLRPGWAPRPGPKVKLVRGWDVPEDMGAGQEFLTDESGHPRGAVAYSGPALAALNATRPTVNSSDLDTRTAEPPNDLTGNAPSATVSAEETPSRSPSKAAPVTRGVLSDDDSAPQTVARAGDVSGALAPPPQGPPSAATRATRSAEPTQTRQPGDPRPAPASLSVEGRAPPNPAYQNGGWGGSPEARTTTVARASGSPSQQAFVQQNLATAKQIQTESGIPYQVLLAIPGNETGWGQAMVGNNYFGIKGKSKTGASSGQVGTWEVINGQRVNVNDEFRAYSGYEESARDFVDFLH